MHRRLITLSFIALLAAPASSFAASATQNGYDDVEVQAETASGGSPESDTAPAAEPADTAPTAQAAPTTASSSNLPFTGLEAGLIAAAGFGLAGTGVALRRAARDQ